MNDTHTHNFAGLSGVVFLALLTSFAVYFFRSCIQHWRWLAIFCFATSMDPHSIHVNLTLV